MSGSSIHLDMSADSPEQMRALFELCMAETNRLLYDGKLVIAPGGGAGQVYVFSEQCPDCNGFGWIGTGSNTCTTCKGRKEIWPAWVLAD